MTELRICRKSIDKDNELIGTGPWHPDSPGNREMLRIIVESGIEIDGPGTHWVEMREMRQQDQDRE